MDGRHADGPTDMVFFEKLTMWPLVIGMFVIGIYPTWLLSFFNTASVRLIMFITGPS